MVNIYCALIIYKRRVFSDIPVSIQAAVEARLKELGYGTDGELLGNS